MHKTAAVIGGGVAGIQAALDLAEMGVQTYLIESDPSIGGRMAQLDKTFPTNDCAMCILSPKLVEAGSHPYITIISHSEILGVEGEAPHMKLRVLKKPRYVNEETCTGCGSCMTACPTTIPDPFNKGLGMTKAIRIPFPQAVPPLPVMDPAICLYHTKGVCRLCEKACQMDAIDFEQTEQILELDIGAIVMAPGSQEVDARRKNEYGCGLFPNVVTSIEFERLLGACGPTSGHVTRPSDGVEPDRIAILQCVGSRDVKTGNAYCSAICCMQAAKDAIVVKEHLADVKVSIFFMDVRAYGKGFERFIERAKDEHDTRYVRSRVSSVESDPATNNLIVHYVTQDGLAMQEEFDLLVLSVGLEPSPGAMETANRLGLRLDEFGFLDVGTFSPVDASRPGVFACGSVSAPRDIPESVMEASGAASAAAAFLGEFPSKEILTEYPAEIDIRGVPIRTGVFVCRCGSNIAATVDVPAVVDYVSTLNGVAHAQELMFTCAQDSQKVIRDVILEKNLNRVVVAACTPRTHEPLFQKTLQATGLNPYMFEFANIREHCSWVHQKEPEKATEKAKVLVENACVRVSLAEPLYQKTLSVDHGALVIGGGLAGMTAAIDLADQGYDVHLVERESKLGGQLRHLRRTLTGDETAPLLQSLRDRIDQHPHIALHLDSTIKSISGYVGNFHTELEDSNAEFTHGVVIVATGASVYEPTEYLRGEDDRVVTQRELEKLLNDSTHHDHLTSMKSVLMIQCVGSRRDDHPYCSRICCSHALKNAIRLKEASPRTSVYVAYRDIRTYGLREPYYQLAREKGVIFVRFEEGDEPQVVKNGKKLSVQIKDSILRSPIELNPDLVVLSVGIVPNPENKLMSQMLKVPLDEDAYFLEAHVKLRPVDFATDGVFVCGLAHYPKDTTESIAQARAAAGRAATVLSKDMIEAEGKVSTVREDACSGCAACVEVCAYNAIELDEARGVAVVNEALCKGCGACAATCRASAIDLKGFRNEMILSALSAL
ncbi:FAD-dependent oxidoreductase [Candidatus Bipolaricaulota bacterium]